LTQRRETLGLPPGDTDPSLEEFSDEEYTFLEDPPELVEARKSLAAYTYRQGEEEPADLLAARRGLAKEGKEVKAGTWKTNDASCPDGDVDPAAAENDGAIYLSSVKASQQQASASPSADDASVKGDQGASRPRLGAAEDRAAAVASALGKGGVSLVSEVDDDARPTTDNADKAVRAASGGGGAGDLPEEVDLTELD